MELYQLCPGASENIYKFGDNILEAKIKAATTEEEQQKHIAELLGMYDNYIKYYPENKGSVLSSKAYSFYDYYKKMPDSVTKAVELFDEAYAIIGNEMPVAHIDRFFQANIKEFNKTKDVDRLFEVYNQALTALEANYNKFNVESFEIEERADSLVNWIAMADGKRGEAQAAKAAFDKEMAAYDSTYAYNNASKKRMKQAAKLPPLVKPEMSAETAELVAMMDKVDELRVKYQIDEEGFTSVDRKKISNNDIRRRNIDKVQGNIERILSPLLTCDKLALIYSDDKFEENKDDKEWLTRAARMLQKERKGDNGEMLSCTDNPVFLKVAERLYALEPSADAARSMARLGVQQNDWAMAKQYFTEAIEQEDDLRKKADDYMGLAVVSSKMGSNSAAKANSLKAAQLRKDWGKPYLFVATLYAQAAADGTWGKNAVEKKAAYWAAINKLTYARSIDPSIEKQADKLISIYKSAVPDKSIAFQLGAKEGDVIKIGSWINETVTVKFY
jgi:tetratricopeptide (TPR) repeat protein